MINFDDLIQEDYKIKSVNSNPLTVQHPARCIIVGASGTGKTNLLLNLLLNKEMKMDYNRIYVIVKDRNEDKYRFLQDYFTDIENTVYEKTKDHLTLLTIVDDLNEVPDLDKDIDANRQNVLIFDDVVTAKNQDVLVEYWIRSRKKNCTLFYLSQTYFKVPKTIRLNTEYFFIFSLNSRRELQNLYLEFGTDIPDQKTFNRMLKEATKNRNFFLIDTKTTIMEWRYRRGLKQFLSLRHYE